MRKRVAILAALTSLTAVHGAGAFEPEKQPVKTRALASFSILENLVADVAQNTPVEVGVLVPAGADSHTFEPSPSLAVAVKNATVIFEIGSGFEPWLDRLAESSGSKAKRIELSEGLDLIRTAVDHDHEHDHEHGHDHDHHVHSHGDFDPHVWTDPTLVASLVPKIAAALSAVAPESSAEFEKNAEALVSRLRALDVWIKEQVATVPEGRRKLVTVHDTFSYFARQYGFEVVGNVLHSISTEANDPSAADSARLVERIKKAGVPAIFPDAGENVQLVRSLAEAAGVTVGGQLHPEALTDASGPAKTYEEMMRHNVTTIVEGLRGS